MTPFFRKHKKLLDNLVWLSWAVMLALCYPVYNFSFLVWFAFIPVLVYVYQNPAHKSLHYAFFYSFVYWMMTLFWLIAFHEVSMPLIAPAYSLYNAFLFFLVIFLSTRFKKIRWLVLPMVWVSGELLRASGYLGFKWNMIGDALWQTPVLMQTADIWGVYGLSFIVLMVNAVLAELIYVWIKKQDLIKALKARCLPLAVTSGLMLFVLLYGVIQYRHYERVTTEAPVEKLALLQPNVGSFEPWWDKRWEHYSAVWNMHAEAALENVDIIVWSEMMLRSYVWPYQSYHPQHPRRVLVERYLALVKEFNTATLMTYPLLSGDQSYNSAEFFQPGEPGRQSFSKIHLTPFGEWFPLYQHIPIVNKAMEAMGAGGFYPASQFTVFRSRRAKFAVMICFEDIFSLMARKYIKRGVNYFLNATNDGWAYRWQVGSDLPLWQHIAGVVGVAISVRRPIARAVNTGVTGIVDPTGTMRVSPVPLYQQGVYIDSIAVIDENIQTLYVRFGYLFPYLVLAVLSVMVLVPAIKEILAGRKTKEKA